MDAYYLAVCKPKPKPSDRLPNWGAYLQELRKLSSDVGVQRAASILQELKEHDRNPIMHPELILNEDDALTLFEIAKSAIMAMAERLPKPRPAKSSS